MGFLPCYFEAPDRLIGLALFLSDLHLVVVLCHVVSHYGVSWFFLCIGIHISAMKTSCWLYKMLRNQICLFVSRANTSYLFIADLCAVAQRMMCIAVWCASASFCIIRSAKLQAHWHPTGVCSPSRGELLPQAHKLQFGSWNQNVAGKENHRAWHPQPWEMSAVHSVGTILLRVSLVC